MIQRKPVCHACTSVVRADEESVVAQLPHHLRDVARHGALAVGRVRIVGWGARRVAIAAKVESNDGEMLCKLIGNAMPHHVRLRMSVQQQERGPTATHPRVNDQL